MGKSSSILSPVINYNKAGFMMYLEEYGCYYLSSGNCSS